MTSGSFANRAFWVLASIALALLILFLVVFVSWMNRLHAVGEAETETKARLAELKNAVTGVNMQQLEEENTRLDAILSVLEKDLPQAAYIPTLLTEIESEARLTRNTHAELRLGEVQKGKVITYAGTTTTDTSAEGAQPVGQRYDEQELVVRFRGSFQSGFDMLKAMARLRKMLYVKEISIRRQGNDLRGDGGAEAEIDFDVTAFVLEPAGGFPGKVVAQVHE